jgi:hypothetical protein
MFIKEQERFFDYTYYWEMLADMLSLDSALDATQCGI